MLNGVSGGAKFLSQKQQNLRKIESSDDFLKADIEEGKTSIIGDFSIKSPNIINPIPLPNKPYSVFDQEAIDHEIHQEFKSFSLSDQMRRETFDKSVRNLIRSNIQKKRIDFGHGNSSCLDSQYIWTYTQRSQQQQKGIEFQQHFAKIELNLVKATNKYDRTFLVDKKGKLYQWEAKSRFSKSQLTDKEEKFIQEIDSEVEGKPLSKHVIKDIAFSSSTLFLATENGEVIVGKPKAEQGKENFEDLFTKRSIKQDAYQNLIFSFRKLNAIQSHFISQISCGSNYCILLTSSGFVYSFGQNDKGQLGHSQQQEEIKEPTIIFQLLNLKVFAISSGKHHNIVIGTSRDTMASTFQIYSTENALFTTIDKNKTLVYGWGCNKFGQLGLGDDKDRQTPTLIDKILDYNFKKISCGNNHSVLLDEGGVLFTFGNNEYGQIGNKSFQSQYTPISIFAIRAEQENQNQFQNYQDDNPDDNGIIITKYVIDFDCSRDSTVCFTDENELFLWGKNILDPDGQQMYDEPILVAKIDDNDLNLNQNDNQALEKIFTIKDTGVIMTSIHRQEDPNMQSAMRSEHPAFGDQSFVSYNKDYTSFHHSQGGSFLRNDNQKSLQHAASSTGISFSKEFENLLQYIAITAGNTNMPDGMKPTFRPGNLPKKTDEEEKFHQRLVEENRKQYIKKKLEREKGMEKKRIEQEKKERKIQEMKIIWEKEILPNWDQVKRTKRVRELWIEGLPPVVKGKVWYYAFGNRNSISKELYYIMADKGRKLRKLLKELSQVDQEIIDNGGQPRKGLTQLDKENDHSQSTEDTKNRNEQQNQSPKLVELNRRFDKLKKKLNFLIGIELQSIQSRERSISIIETDLPRTFPTLGFFKQGGVHYDQLQRILEAFTMHRPDIGYVQGMSYVAAVLLLYMDEHSAFVTFCNMITKFPIMPFYTFNETLIKKVLQLFKQVFQHNLPDLCEHLEMENIQPKQYVYEWFMTLFTRALGLTLLTRVWDLYFLDGIQVLFQTSIALLRILEKQLIDEDFEGIIKILRNVSDHVTDEEEMVNYMYDVSFPKWVYDELPKLESEFLNQLTAHLDSALQSPPKSKSKQMLKKCINEMGGIREKGNPFGEKGVTHKIAAPKPVRARPLALTHMANSKWLETSPIKNENPYMESSSLCGESNEDKTVGGTFNVQLFLDKRQRQQNEQNSEPSENGATYTAKGCESPMSDLKSLLEAEAELSAIFSKNKDPSYCYGYYNQASNHTLWSPDKNTSVSTITGNSEQLSYRGDSDVASNIGVGFSKFGQFKAPIKRPKCNPIVKDERFKRMNLFNEDQVQQQQQVFQSQNQEASCNFEQQDLHCDTQVFGNTQGSTMQQQAFQNSQFMAAYSQTTSPTAYSSGLNPFSFMDYSGINSNQNYSWMNGSCPQMANLNCQMQQLCLSETQVPPQQPPSDFTLQMQPNPFMMVEMNLPNSAPEFDTAYLTHYQVPFQQMAPLFQNMSYTSSAFYLNQ